MNPKNIAQLLNDIARLETSGNYKKAMMKLRPMLKTARPGPYVVEAYAVLSKHYNEQEKAISLLEDTLRNFSLNPAVKSRLHFQAGNLYDEKQEYDKAFSHYESANNSLPIQFNPQALQTMIQVQKQFFTQKSMAEMPRADNDNELPIFIIGMPRSGTSLTEQIMNQHSKIHGAGELNTINEIIASIQQRWSLSSTYPSCLAELTSAQLNTLAEQYLSSANKDAVKTARITDKMPGNGGHLGLIEMILPSAKVIHCKRNPIDTCLSCYFQNFANSHQYSRNLEYTAKMYRLYLDMVGMWDGVVNIPIHELRYEDMINNQETASRQLIEFSGLDWEEECLRFNESKRHIKTCSYNQVRKPIYTSSVHRWKNYEKHIGPLLDELEDIVEQYDFNPG